MLPETTRQGLCNQLDALDLLLEGASPTTLIWRPERDQWSAHENLAHLARHHQLMLDRLQRIVAEDKPQLGRYRAEDDPEWPAWAALSTNEVMGQLRALRRKIIEWSERCSDQDLDRIGVHPLFGEMTVAHWLEFFLLHEAHHLYVVMLRLGQAKRVIGPDEEI